MYFFRLMQLLISRKITLLTALSAMTTRPVIVAGRRCGYVVDDSFDMGQK